MEEALSDHDSEAALMVQINRQLVQESPQRAKEVEEDRRQAETRVMAGHQAAVSEVRNAAARARQTIGRLPPGAQVGVSLPLDATAMVPVGTSVEDAATMISAWELAGVEAADHDRMTALRAAYEQYLRDMHDAGLGWLPTPDRIIREAMDYGTVALRLVPDHVREGIAGLAEFLPQSSAEGVSVRTIHRDPFEARRQARRFDAGLAALKLLVN